MPMEFQNCQGPMSSVHLPFFPFVSGGACFDCSVFVQALQIFLDVEHTIFWDSREDPVSTCCNAYYSSLRDGGVDFEVWVLILWNFGVPSFWDWGRCLLTSFKESKMNQVADQRVFCLVLIIFTKYFWFSAFQAYSSGIYIYWHLLTLTELLHACVLIHFSHVRLFATLWTVAHQTPLSMGLCRQAYCYRLPCSPPEDLPDPGIEPSFLMPFALAGVFFTTRVTWEAQVSVVGCSQITGYGQRAMDLLSYKLTYTEWRQKGSPCYL